jgi:hypothetical protein
VARIRSLKPEFFRNEQLAELPYSDRLLFAGLWTQADKAGRLEDRPKRLKGELFPYDDLNVDEALGRLANARLIVRYEGNGQRLIAIPTWGKHQQPHVREADSILPAPDGMVLAPCKPQSSRSDQEGKGADPDQEGKETRARERFERFWAAYPRKVGKDAAWAIWQRRSPGDDLTDQMVAAVERQRHSSQWMKDGGAFIPHPRTWLHQGRWQDDEQTPAAVLNAKTVQALRGIHEA